MEEKTPLIQELSLCVTKDFNLASEELISVHDLTELKKKITQAIHYLLHHDMHKLLSIFYRLDVEEHKVNQIIHTAPPDRISEALADLTIERELKKIETRRRYKDFS